MGDIFEIKTAKIEIKIGNHIHEIVDPKLIDKVSLSKEWDSLSKKKEKLDASDFVLKAYDLNKKTIRMYIPSMTEEFIEKELTGSTQELLIAKIMELSEQKFGAVIEKSEKK